MKIVELRLSDGVYTMHEAKEGVCIPDEVWDEYQAHETACARWYERLREIDNIWLNDKLTTAGSAP